MPTEYPYNFVQVKKGDFIRIPTTGENVEMERAGLAVVFTTTGDVLGPYKSRHEAEIEAGHHARSLLYGGNGKR
jgi:hypothetical protein